MNRRFFFLFLFCFAVLICSEYLLVTEVFNGRRMPVLLGSALALLGSIVGAWWSYRKFRKAAMATA